MLNRGTIRKVRSFIILTIDLVTGLVIFSSVYHLRMNQLPDYSSPDLWLILLTLITTLYLAGTYFKERSHLLPALPIRTFFISLIGGTFCIAWVYLLGPTEFNSYFGRGILPVGTLLFGVATTLTRYSINSLYHFQERGLELLYIGYSKSCDALLVELKNHAEVRSISIVCDKKEAPNDPRITYYDGTISEALSQQGWQVIIVDPEHQTSADEKSMLVSARLSGTPVISLTDYYELNWYMIPVNHIGDDWFLRAQGFSMLGNPVSQRLKRIADFVLATILLILSMPLLLICGLLIKLTSKGPILFSQTRIGFQGAPFTIFKLRTMQVDAEQDGAQWAQSNDPRITAIGGFLRRSRLDEIPQCWNVLIGDMSFVGPRPERPEFTAMLAEKIPYYDIRHTVKPGISGWAQVIFPYGASTEDALRKLQYELYYIKHQSLLLDLNIMIRTLFTVFQRAGR